MESQFAPAHVTWKQALQKDQDGHIPLGALNSNLPNLAAIYQLRDLDTFIDATAVPPPPPLEGIEAPIERDDDLKAFIIPPPPSAGRRTPSASVDREVQEVDVRHQVVRGDRDKISPKIASLQQKLLSPTEEDGGGITAAKDNTLVRRRSSEEPSPPKAPFSAENTPVKSILKRQEGTPVRAGAPPPPPPRSVVSRSVLLTGKYGGSIPSYEFGQQSTAGKPNPASLRLALKGNGDAKVNGERSPGSPPNKMSMTSSSDSLSSTTSVNTVKSVSPGDGGLDDNGSEPPSLPPRSSPVKSAPATPAKSAQMANGVKPELPSRTSKPTTPVKSPARSLPAPPNGDEKPALAPKGGANGQKKTVVRIKENGVSYPAAEDEQRPALPQKKVVNMMVAAATNAANGRKLPLAPPPPPAKPLANGAHVTKTSNGFILNGEPEIYSNSEFDPDDSSLEGTSVDDEEDTDGSGGSAGRGVGDDDAAGKRVDFKMAEELIERALSDIDKADDLCNGGGGGERSREALEKAREALTTESRHFVTASKLFVKSATESEGQMADCLDRCARGAGRLAALASQLAACTPASQADQSRTLVARVREVAEAYLQTVRAADAAVGRGMGDPAMGVLMKRATGLAGVLTTLMRSLRVFN